MSGRPRRSQARCDVARAMVAVLRAQKDFGSRIAETESAGAVAGWAVWITYCFLKGIKKARGRAPRPCNLSLLGRLATGGARLLGRRFLRRGGLARGLLLRCLLLRCCHSASLLQGWLAVK